VHGVPRGTVISLVGPLAGQPGVGEPVSAAIKRPMIVASGPPAITADCLPAAISAYCCWAPAVSPRW
jgi:hypothetical protein